MNITIDTIIEFLQDHNLGPIKIKKNNGAFDFELVINEPHIWGTNDTKKRCGITSKYIEKDGQLKQVILFNAFKASALYGEEYRGSFFKFIKNIENFETINQAKKYFIENYLLKYNDLQNLINDNCLDDDELQPNSSNSNLSLTLPDHLEKLDVKNHSHQPYYQYLLSRNINQEIIKRNKIFIDKIERRVVFPVYENNQLIFYTGRDITGINILRWKNSKVSNIQPIWNLDNVHNNVVYVFEGIFDAIHFRNGIALMGSGTQKQFEKILYNGFSKICLIFDNDEVGRKAKIKWAKWLSSKGHKNIYIFNYSGIDKKDFSSIYEANLNINIRERLFYWNYDTEIKFKLNQIN